ncbi:MAG: AMP-binding protein [Bryobacteraceae bacterium]
MHLRIDFFERLERYANQRPDDVALQGVSADIRYALTWRALAGEIRHLGWQLNLIVHRKTGAHVGLLMDDSPRWGVAFLAAYSAGSVIVPLDPSQSAAALSDIVAHSECEALIFSERYAGVARLIAEANQGLALIDDSCSPAVSRESTAAPLPLVNRDPAADLAILYTGGTTGSAKGVRITEANLFWSVWDMLAVCPITADDHILSILPLFHVMSLLANLLGPLYVGAKVTYLSGRDPARILAAFQQEQVTAFLCVPQFYYLLVRRIFEHVDLQSRFKRFAFYRLLSLSRFLRRRMKISVGRVLFHQIHHRFGAKFRLFGVGAASFAPDVAEAMLNLGFNLFQAYGMTETAGPVTVDAPGPSGGSACGPPLPHAQIRIQNPDRDGVGEILIAGEHLTPGYWKDPQATAELIRDGWLWSGDLGFMDSSGRLRVTGRKKEVIVLSSGKNVFPEQVEYQIQKRSEFIREVCVLGCVSASGVEEFLHAVIVPDFDRLRDRGVANIRDQIRYDLENTSRSLPTWQRVRRFEIRDTPLPRTSTRKLKRFDVHPNIASSAIRGNAPAADDSEPAVFALIRRIKKNCGPISADSNLELDLGFDSLERVELLSNMRTQFGIEISDEQATRIFTAGDLAGIVDKAAPAQDGSWVSWPEILRAPLSQEQQTIASLYLRRRRVLERTIFIFCRLAGFAARLLLKLRITGVEDIPRECPLIICSNHASYLDALLIAAALPFPVFCRLFFLSAKKYMRTPRQRWFAQLVRGIAIDAGANSSGALRLAAAGLEKGLILCVFPEGHRSIDGSLLPFHNGPSILAREQSIPILPVGITGTQRVWGRGSARIRLSPVEVRFGTPIDPASSPNHEQLTLRLQEAVGKLLKSPVDALS